MMRFKKRESTRKEVLGNIIGIIKGIQDTYISDLKAVGNDKEMKLIVSSKIVATDQILDAICDKDAINLIPMKSNDISESNRDETLKRILLTDFYKKKITSLLISEDPEYSDTIFFSTRTEYKPSEVKQVADEILDTPFKFKDANLTADHVYLSLIPVDISRLEENNGQTAYHCKIKKTLQYL